LTVCKQRKNEKPIVIGTKNIDWRHTLHTPQYEVNVSILPVESAKSGSMGVVCMHFDLLPALTKAETLTEEAVEKQLALEHKFKTQATNQFLDYST
jgi:hypothetical protein